MGWSGCFPREDSLEGLPTAPGEAAHAYQYTRPGLDRHRHRQGSLPHRCFGADGKIAFRRKIKRLALLETFKKLSPCVVGMEACLSAHFVSRTLRQLGHHPRIIPAIY
jgi:transposase